MANTSIFNAFERMWQHVVAALGNKSDIDHSHTVIPNELDMSSNKITGLGTPTDNTDAATKAYADGKLSKTGDKFGAASVGYYTPDDTGGIWFRNGTAAAQGAGLWLNGNGEGKDGTFLLQTYDTANSAWRAFRGFPNGDLYWNGGKVYHEKNKPTPEAIGATKIVRLYKNSSSTFAAQTLNIGDFSGYSHIGIVPTFHKSGDRRLPLVLINSGGSTGFYICGNSSSDTVSRLISDVNASAGTITFGNGYKNGTADDGAAMPYLILGFL